MGLITKNIWRLFKNKRLCIWKQIFNSSSEISPDNMYTFAVLAIGFIPPPAIICKHSTNEFAVWSNWPGKNSMANTLSALKGMVEKWSKEFMYKKKKDLTLKQKEF